MKRRTHPQQRVGIAPYTKYGKHPYNYSAMYHRCPWLRQPQQERQGQSAFGYLSRPEDANDETA